MFIYCINIINSEAKNVQQVHILLSGETQILEKGAKFVWHFMK